MKEQCYKDSNGNYVYRYQALNDEGKLVDVQTVIEVTPENYNLIAMLAEFDRQEKLQERYKNEHEDYLVHRANETNVEGEDCRESFFEKIINTRAVKLINQDEVDETKYNEFMDSLTEDQRDLIRQHVNLGKPLREIAEGYGVSTKAVESRWQKIRERASKYYGIPLTKKGRKDG